MARLPDEEMDGRLNAQREAIALLFAVVARQWPGADLPALIQGRAGLADHQEDPGAVAVDGFAAQEARRKELVMLARDVAELIRSGAGHAASTPDV
ncbi:MAG: hypothetical protein R3D65_03840 [Zhengella sp.]|uniref:hypothetical protein n=1 Tax=Zhengella sp. TaxID=2282762 RepID=UPI003528C68C|nr:hypothetical protein [Brucellaceae bacterium]